MSATHPVQEITVQIEGSKCLHYIFDFDGGSCGLTISYEDGHIEHHDTQWVMALYDCIRAGEAKRPLAVKQVSLDYWTFAYDGLFVAMWLLGYSPVVKHRSRTYMTGILDIRKCGDLFGGERLLPVGVILWHRYTFGQGQLHIGLPQLLLKVYGLIVDSVAE